MAHSEDAALIAANYQLTAINSENLVKQNNMTPKECECDAPYSDWCNCLKLSRKKGKLMNVKSTITTLIKNNIEFQETNIPNVVLIDSGKVMLSLKKKNNLFKLKYIGNNIWYTYSRQMLIEQFSKK